MPRLENILPNGRQLRGAQNNKYTHLELSQHILYSHYSFDRMIYLGFI